MKLPANRDQAPAAPGWIAGYALPPDLADYLGAVLRRGWPKLRWSTTADRSALARWRVDLWVVVEPPGEPTFAPQLWLRSPARGERWYREDGHRWCLRAPVLTPALHAVVRAILAAGELRSDLP